MLTFLEYGWSIAIDPSYISKSGKKTPHIGSFWSGCASSMKHGLEIMGLALVDVYANNCMMLRAHQTPSTGELKLRNMTLVQHYIAVIKRYKKDLLKVTDIVVADAFFSIRLWMESKSTGPILSAASAPKDVQIAEVLVLATHQANGNVIHREA